MRIVSILFFVFSFGIVSLNAQEFELFKSFEGHEAGVSFVVFRSEDNLVVSGDEDGKVIIWNNQNGKKIHQINDHDGLVTHIAFSNSGNYLASASYDGTIRLYETNTFRTIKVIENSKIDSYDNMNGNEPSFIAFSPDDKGIFYGGYNLEVLYTDFKNNQTKRVFSSNEYAITCGQISPDKRHLAIGYGHNIRFIDLKNFSNFFTLKNPPIDKHFICEISFQPETQNIAAWNYGGALQIWNVKRRKVESTIQATKQSGTSNMAFSGSGQFVVTGNFGNQTKLWDLHENHIIQILGKHKSEVVSFSYSIDGNFIVTGSKDNVVNLWKRLLPEQDEINEEIPITEPIQEEVVKEETFKEIKRKKNKQKKPRIVFITDEESNIPPSQKKETLEEIDKAEGIIPQDKIVEEIPINEFEEQPTIPDKIVKEIPIKERHIETQHEIKVNSQEIELSFWDNQKVDGDTISVNLNGVWLLQNYSLKKRKKRVKVTLDKKVNYIIIHAHNEGRIPPNTLSLMISGEGQQKIYSLNSDLKKSGAVKVVYDP